MVKVLIIGATGLLGQAFLKLAEEHEVYGTFHIHPFKYPGTNIIDIDLNSPSQIINKIEGINPDLIINCAGRTNIDYCEVNPIDAYTVNVLAVRNMVAVAKRLRSFFIQISTDFVFNGVSNIPYDENAEPSPISTYGDTKYKAELEVKNSLTDYLIIRIGALFGMNRVSAKKNFATWIIDNLRFGKKVSLISDQHFSFTYAEHAYKVIFDLYSHETTGLYNVAAKNCLTYYELGKKLAEIFGFDLRLIEKTGMKKERFIANRPRYSCLDVSKVESVLGYPMIDLDSALRKLKEDLDLKNKSL